MTGPPHGPRMAVSSTQALLQEVHKLQYLQDTGKQNLLQRLCRPDFPQTHFHCTGVVTSRPCSTGHMLAGHNTWMYRGEGSGALVPAQGDKRLELQDKASAWLTEQGAGSHVDLVLQACLGSACQPMAPHNIQTGQRFHRGQDGKRGICALPAIPA